MALMFGKGAKDPPESTSKKRAKIALCVLCAHAILMPK